MKLLFIFILLFSSLYVTAQKTALLDKRFKQPIIFTDSVTVEQVSKAYLPIPVRDFDTLDANLRYLEDMLSKAQRAKMASFELRAGNVVLSISRIPMAYADRYDIVLKSELNELTSLYTFSDANSTNGKALDKIKAFRSYLRKNKSLFTAPYEIHPKIYNVVVIAQ